MQSETSLQNSASHLKDIFETLAEGVALNEMLFDERGTMIDYRILEVNDAFYRFADYRRDQPVIGNTATTLYGMTSEVIEGFYHKHRGLTQTAEEDYQSPVSGRWFHITTSPFKNGRFITTFQDVTEQRANQRLLARQKTMLDRTEQLAKIGSWEWESVHDQVTWSDEMFRLFGIDPEGGAIPFADHAKLYEADSWARLKAAVDRALSEGIPYELELRAIRRDGGVMTCLARGFPDLGLGESAMRLYGTLQDITEVRSKQRETQELQEQLFQSQKLENLGLLAGGIAHDMNNILAAIAAVAAAQAETLSPENPSMKGFETIQLAVKRGGNLVSGLLQFTRKNVAQVRPVDLNALIQEQMALLGHTTLSQVRFHANFAPSLPWVTWDESALGLVFMNLWINAVTAMKEQESERVLSVSTRQVQGRVEVVIADNGPGMPTQIQSRAGQPFVTTKPSGSGLGLYLVYSIVKAHNGEISVEAGPHRGTRFTMLFPAIQGVESPQEAGPTQGRPTSVRRKDVLLVDDDPDVLESTSDLLTVLGCSVQSCDRGESALISLKAGGHFDLVILDMNMPGLGGPKTLFEIRSHFPTLPVAVSTGLADQGVLDLVASTAHTTLLAKPFEVSSLKQLLSGSSGETPN